MKYIFWITLFCIIFPYKSMSQSLEAYNGIYLDITIVHSNGYIQKCSALCNPHDTIVTNNYDTAAFLESIYACSNYFKNGIYSFPLSYYREIPEIWCGLKDGVLKRIILEQLFTYGANQGNLLNDKLNEIGQTNKIELNSGANVIIQYVGIVGIFNISDRASEKNFPSLSNEPLELVDCVKTIYTPICIMAYYPFDNFIMENK